MGVHDDICLNRVEEHQLTSDDIPRNKGLAEQVLWGQICWVGFQCQSLRTEIKLMSLIQHLSVQKSELKHFT